MSIKHCIGACCDFGRERFPGQSFSTIADDAGQPVVGSVLPVDAEVRPLDFEVPITLGVAAHEAAHAVVGVLGSMEVERVEVGAISQMTSGGSRLMTNGGLIKMLLAGIAAQNKTARHEYRMRNAEILEFVHAARERRGGGCDFCRVAQVIAPLEDDAAVVTWRTFEADTLELINRPAVWRAIRNIATLLVERRELTGAEVREAMMAAGPDLDAEHKELCNA